MSGLGRQGTQDALQIKKRVLTHLYSKPPFIYVETEALRGRQFALECECFNAAKTPLSPGQGARGGIVRGS